MRLIACRSCHAQYDVERIAADRFSCRCGATVENRPPPAHDAAVVRCGSCGASLAPGVTSCSFCGSTAARQPDPTGPVCPECFARTPAGSRFCTACGAAFRPEPLPEETRELPCPACSAPMRPREVAGLRIDECGRCEGLWIPEGRLEPLLERAREARAARADGRVLPWDPRVRGGNPTAQRVQYRRCPECDAHMQRRNFRRNSGVIVDVCRHHGTWLDADELEQIAGFVLGREPDADFVSARRGPYAPPRAKEADAAFARILVEHRGRGSRAPDRSLTLLDILFGLVR